MWSPRSCPRSFYLSVAYILELSSALLARDRPVDDTKPSSSNKPAHAACASGFSDTEGSHWWRVRRW
jgi:hypothetical protein